MNRQASASPAATAKVAPLRRGPSSSLTGPDLTRSVVWEILNHPEFATRLKEEVESAVLGALLIERAKSMANVNDPFGPIYISALKPDCLHAPDVANLARLASIRDLSDKLEIVDGWDA